MLERAQQKISTTYLSAKLVLIQDFLLSMAASYLVLSAVNILAHSGAYGSLFSITYLVSAAMASITSFLTTRTYRFIIRHTTLREVMQFGLAVLAKILLTGLSIAVFNGELLHQHLLILAADMVITFSLLIAVRVILLYIYNILNQRKRLHKEFRHVLIWNANEHCAALMEQLKRSTRYSVRGFLSPNVSPSDRLTIDGVRIYPFRDLLQLEETLEAVNADTVLFQNESDAKAQKEIVDFLCSKKIRVMLSPHLEDISSPRSVENAIREIRIEDLLSRPEIKISLDKIKSSFAGKTVMVTGAAGSIGSELVRQLCRLNVKLIVLFDNAETPMHYLRLDLDEHFPDVAHVPFIGDVRNMQTIDTAFSNWHPQIVFHAAAYKHVPLMEENPCEAISVNVAGSRQIADKCAEYGVEMMVMISTDKAVNPTSIMGCSKRIAEMYVQSFGTRLKQQGGCNTSFVTTRFGNVLGSNGSVIPRFLNQIKQGGPITVTHPDITRYFMTIPEACRLVMEAAVLSNGNEIFVFDMGEVVRIADMAKRMIKLAGLEPGKDIDIVYTGLRPGEKLYEEVLANEETTSATQHDRIRIAQVRMLPYDKVKEGIEKLLATATCHDNEQVIRLMQELVPEYTRTTNK